MTTTYIINILLFVIPVIITLYATFYDKFRRPFLLTFSAAIILFIGASYAASLIAALYTPTRFNRTMISTASVVCGTLLFYLVMQYRFCQSIFIVTITKCFVDDVALISSGFYLTFKGTLPESFSTFPIWPIFIIDLCATPLILLFFKNLLRPVLDETMSYPFWKYIWIIPLCSNTLYPLCISPLFTADAIALDLSYDLIPILWTTFSFTTFFMILLIIKGTSKTADLKSQLNISDLQKAAQLKQIETLQRNITRNRRARHDMRHHILTIQGLLAGKEYDEALEYLEQYNNRLESMNPSSYTPHSILNAVLTYYRDLAETNNIATDFTFALDDVLPASSMDICIILGNLLENAVEACSKQTSGERFLNLHMAMTTPTNLVIIIENSYSGIIREENGSFLSSKEEGRIGIGIDSVRNLVDQYNGVCKIDHSHNIFRIKLLLNKPTEIKEED